MGNSKINISFRMDGLGERRTRSFEFIRSSMSLLAEGVAAASTISAGISMQSITSCYGALFHVLSTASTNFLTIVVSGCNASQGWRLADGECAYIQMYDRNASMRVVSDNHVDFEFAFFGD